VCVVAVCGWYVCKRLDERQYALLSSLETDERGEPAAFSDVQRSVMTGQTGQLEITQNARRAHRHDGLLFWTPVNSSHYYYAPVSGKHSISSQYKSSAMA